MAGTILLTQDVGVPMDGFSFAYISNLIRSEFPAEEEYVRDRVFWHQDVGGMSVVSAIGLDFAEFKIFASAVVAARDRARNGQNFQSYSSVWSDLVRLIREDERGRDLALGWN